MKTTVRPTVQSVTVQQNGSSVTVETVVHNIVVQAGIQGPPGDGGTGGAVSWDDVQDKPATFPAGGGAGGVLSGTFPNPGFAVNMATQAELDDAIATRAPSSHTHEQSDIVGLDSALAGKANSSHTHPLSNLTQSGATSGQAPVWNGTQWAPATVATAPGGSNDQTQFNSGGVFGGFYGLVKTSGQLSSINFGTGANGSFTGALGAGGLLIGRADAVNPATLTGYTAYAGDYNGPTFTLPNNGVFGIASSTGSLWVTRDTGLARAAAGIFVFTDGSTTGAGSFRLRERTAPGSAPPTNAVDIWAEDNGSGKTRIMARFATGAAVQIAIEP